MERQGSIAGVGCTHGSRGGRADMVWPCACPSSRAPLVALDFEIRWRCGCDQPKSATDKV